MAHYNSTFSGTQIDANLTLASTSAQADGVVLSYNIALYGTDSTLSSYSATNGVYLNGNSSGWLELNGDGSQRNHIKIYGDTNPLNGINFNTGATEVMRIDSTGNVGIGTSSPTTKIHVKSDSNDSLVNTIGLSPSTTDNIQGGLGVVAGGQVSINGANIVTATTAGTERLRIDSSGQVGIGTASPSGLLQIYESGTSAYKTYTATGTGAILQSYQSQGSPYTKTTDLVAGSDGTVPSEIRMHTRTAGSSSVDERMRIDSSGNVGVGATAPATTLDVRSTDPVIRLKATGGTADKNTYELRTIGAAGFEGFAIRSRNDSGSVADTHIQIVDGGNVGIGTTTPSAALDVIGDIEVSGGVYLGGTAAANKLDDYEEGTWTPTFTGASGVALYGVQQGKYTKVGNTVTVTGELQAKRNTLSGDITLTGLPFSASGSNAGVTFGFVMRTLTDMPNLKGYIGGSVINIRDQATNATGSTSVTETDLKDTATTDNYIYFSATYLAA